MKTGMYTTAGYSRILDAGTLAPEVLDPNTGVIRFQEYEALAQVIADITRYDGCFHFAETFALPPSLTHPPAHPLTHSPTRPLT